MDMENDKAAQDKKEIHPQKTILEPIAIFLRRESVAGLTCMVRNNRERSNATACFQTAKL
jgi:hypothetical protein